MNSELTALAASGATTLVSLMATDSWTHARQLAGRFLARSGSGGTALADLDHTRTRLVNSDTADVERAARELVDQWRTQLVRSVTSGLATSRELRDLLNSLRRLADTAAPGQCTVHNEVNGGVQNAPVIQAGRISGLTVHVQHPQDGRD
ncbi:hypothetical protein [Streptomyces sp. NPDC020917]|uniref:hypothetical protein n=1 Tax=Streptomyces sp. NPDC020917 TaxID=3365102 RepID=UPI0037A42B25